MLYVLWFKRIKWRFLQLFQWFFCIEQPIEAVILMIMILLYCFKIDFYFLFYVFPDTTLLDLEPRFQLSVWFSLPPRSLTQSFCLIGCLSACLRLSRLNVCLSACLCLPLPPSPRKRTRARESSRSQGVISCVIYPDTSRRASCLIPPRCNFLHRRKLHLACRCCITSASAGPSGKCRAAGSASSPGCEARESFRTICFRRCKEMPRMLSRGDGGSVPRLRAECRRHEKKSDYCRLERV